MTVAAVPSGNEPTAGAKPLARANEPTDADLPAHDARLIEAARQFEAIFVRQLLESSGIGGSGGKQGYRAMVVDSLARAVTSGPGLGLAQLIEAMISQAHRAESGEP